MQQVSQISFLSSSITVEQLFESMFCAEIAGILTLHGATLSMGVTAQVVLGNDTLRATGDFTIRQSDFGIKIATVAGGTLKVRDELRFCLYIMARRTAQLTEDPLAAKASQTADSSVLH